VTATRTPPTVGRLLLAGLLALFALSALGTALALATTRAVDAELAAVEHLADTSRRLERVGALFREFYMHQAHLALGMDEAEHLGLTRDARASLGDALTALEAPPVDAVVAQTLPRLREQLAGLDRLLEAEFLPALRAGHASHAAHLHHQAAGSVQAATARIDADQQTLRLAITEARARAAEVTTASITEAALVLSSALVLALGVGFWMVRAVRGPIERLRTAAASLPDRPPGTRVPEDGPAEVAALGRSLNGALAELDRQRQARAEAETMASLGRIAAGVAHEINNPLAVMLGHARVLEAVVGPEDAASARAIADEARHCQHIVQDLLDYARPGLAERVRLEFGELVRGVGERACAGEVDFRGPAEALHVLVDARRLEAVLRNLLVNAEAFGRRITLALTSEQTPQGRCACLSVIDDGPGVAPDALERIFEPFFTTRPEGTGLGLAIARAVVVAHGGTLVARPGPGGRFELRLPLAPA
jgi:two-component system NtrC family sensor kinase